MVAGRRDDQARDRILARVRRASLGNFGDSRVLKRGVIELRLAYGPGYRIYGGRVAAETIVLLCGGTKKTQVWDIRRAYLITEEL